MPSVIVISFLPLSWLILSLKTSFHPIIIHTIFPTTDVLESRIRLTSDMVVVLIGYDQNIGLSKKLELENKIRIMSKPPQRDILKIIFTNFINSLKPRQMRGTYIGEDYFGNKYYEIKPNPSVGKHRRERWFEPADKEAFDNEVTAEWEAWLRGRREEPPTREELVRNLSIMQIKKKNAAELDEKYGKASDDQQIPRETKGSESFPKYDEYETVPGRGPKKKH